MFARSIVVQASQGRGLNRGSVEFKARPTGLVFKLQYEGKRKTLDQSSQGGGHPELLLQYKNHSMKSL